MSDAAQAARLALLHAAASDSPWRETDFAALLTSPGALLLDAPRAFLLARIAADEVEILMIATATDARRQGHARALMNRFHVAARDRGATHAFLEVAADNTGARALYDAAGYRPAGLRRGYYPRPGHPPVDALVLSRSL